MIECLIYVLVVALGAVLVVYIAEVAVTAAGLTLPPPVWMLVRLIAGLIVLLYAWRCLAPALRLP